MSNPLVSVIVATRNNHDTLDTCLASIVNQTYEPIELIVVDRDSTDGTKMIARYYTDRVFSCSAQRSAQRNLGAGKALGQYVMFIDPSMELTPHVIQDCVDVVQYRPQTKGIIIPEASFGRGFWARCKRLERSFYAGNDAVEAARFFTKEVFDQIGGYGEHLLRGEDWDMTARVRGIGRIERVTALIRHNEDRLKLTRTLRETYRSGERAKAYLTRNKLAPSVPAADRPLARYKLFLSHPRRLLKSPFVSIGMLFMKACEYSFGAFGYLFSSKKERA